MERYTSVSDMHFKTPGLRAAGCELKDKNSGFRIPDSKLGSLLKGASCCLLLGVCLQLIFSSSCNAELIDRVIAFVDDTAITQREFEEIYEKSRKTTPDISGREVLNAMINRILLLSEGKKRKIEAATDDELINEYIDLKVKAFVKIREEDVENFYNGNAVQFKGQSYESARDKIEEYLTELETNKLLKRHVKELRASAYVKIIAEQP